MRSQCLEATALGGTLLRVEFFLQGDRYGHAISLVHHANATTRLLESIEGTPSDPWPPSPPLQSLHIEQLPDGRRAALLVGMAGRSHWSASVEAVVGEAKLIFDIACRHAEKPIWLGCRYRRLRGDAALLQITGEQVRLADSDEIVSIVPAILTTSGTIRWKYIVSWTGTNRGAQ